MISVRDVMGIEKKNNRRAEQQRNQYSVLKFDVFYQRVLSIAKIRNTQK